MFQIYLNNPIYIFVLFQNIPKPYLIVAKDKLANKSLKVSKKLEYMLKDASKLKPVHCKWKKTVWDSQDCFFLGGNKSSINFVLSRVKGFKHVVA